MDLHLPFGHKEEEVGSIPTEEVKKMRESGKSDREIIVELKNKGYPFQAVEKAMLEALKSGVSSERGPPPSREIPAGPPPGINSEFEPSPLREPTPTEPNRRLPTREELMPRPTLPTGQTTSLEMQSGPVDLIEEVVEGVVEEKFEKLDTRFEAIQKEHEKVKEDIENLKNIFASSIQKRDTMIEETRIEFDKLKDEFEDIVIKCSALEKAFKQFLPDLTERVRKKNLSEKGVEVVE